MSRATRRLVGWSLRTVLCVAALGVAAGPAHAQYVDSLAVPDRPFVPGGFDDKPYLTGLFGRISVGGYVEANAVWEKADGALEEASFLLQRWNLLVSSRISEHMQLWAEVEFEDGGNEIVLELAQLDLELHPAASVRGGMLLLPLGRFNLAHDGPRNPFVDRPLLATDLLGTALSMPGFGLFGRLPFGEEGRATYEAYAVNGYHDGLLLDSPDGTRLPFGKQNAEDLNQSPAGVARLAFSPREHHELGISGYAGAYNVFRADGLEVDERRGVRVLAVDARTRLLNLEFNGELAAVNVDIPDALAGLYARQQAGFFVEAVRPFGHGWFGGMPDAFLSAAVRLERVDFDREVTGDTKGQVSAALNFHPTRESALKLDYQRSRSRDRFNNPSAGAALKLSLTSYF